MKLLVILWGTMALTCLSANGGSVPEKYCGTWILEGVLSEGTLQPPQHKHIIILEASGKWTWRSMRVDKSTIRDIDIGDDGTITVKADDGILVSAGKATLDAKDRLHISVPKVDRHMVYLRVEAEPEN